ncbi:MAG: rod-binding protein [Desulfosarcinaceae bacterium]|jgi:Rod binding domain-containing protein
MAGPIDLIKAPRPLALKSAHSLNRPAKPQPLDNQHSVEGETQKLKAACDSFEALFMQQLLKQMRATVPKDAMFGGGSAEQIYTEMLDAELSKEMASGGGLGISRLLFDSMTAAQGTGSETKD